MKIAIIGAGMAGLTAARLLNEAGHEVEVFEKSRGVGGRMATRRSEGGAIFDHGAQTVKPGDTGLMRWMEEETLSQKLIRIPAPTRIFRASGEILPPDLDHAEPQYAYVEGITAFPKHLAAKLDKPIRFQTRIARLVEQETDVSLVDTDGNEAGSFDAVIVTAPAPQAADLLEASAAVDSASHAKRIALLRTVPYVSCLSILLAYPPPVPEAPAYALLAEDRSSALLWLAFEKEKSAARSPDGGAVLVAQLGPDYSARNYQTDDEAIIAETLPSLKPLFGETYSKPAWSQVKRWRYSQPRGHADFAEANASKGRIVVCGDGLRPGNGRIQEAYLSGIEAAEAVMKRFDRG